MNEQLEMQIVKLVEEICEDERELVELRKSAADTLVDSWRKRYNDQADRVEESMNRKLNLLTILKK